MKTSIVWLTALGILAWGPDALAAKKFQGMIEYKFEVSGGNAAIAALIVPTSIKMWVRGNDLRIELTGGMMSVAAPVVIRRAKEHKIYTIIASDQKVMVADDPAVDSSNQTPAEKFDDATMIGGYPCRKYGVRQPDGAMAYVWTTDSIEMPPKAISSGTTTLLSQSGVPGLVMKVVIAQEGMEVTLEASEVDMTKPDKSLFVIPKTYTRVDAEAP